MAKFNLVITLFFGAILSIHAQNQRVEGAIIKDFGATFEVDNPDIKTNISEEFKIILDVSQSSQDKSVMNKNIVTAARFLNMHANEGMSAKQLKAAMTIHAGAWQDILTNKAYKEKFGVDNPNHELINQLTEAGVEIILCGQTASFRNIQKEDINPNVKLALSAMTALIQYQRDGYTFIKF